MRIVFSVAMLGVMACATKTIETVSPSTTVSGGGSGAPLVVAAAFMEAVDDSNLTQMGSLWGTEAGPAATVNKPADWGQRIAIMHAYLKGGKSRVIGEGEASLNRANRRQVLIELSRNGCVKTVPFTMVLTKDGSWIVNSVDLNAAGVPGKPCEPASKGT